MPVQTPVTCISKPHLLSPHEHITHIGGFEGGKRWKITREEAIHRIDHGTNTFYVEDPKTKKISFVGVVRPTGSNPYLRTHSDGDWNNNLLSLTQCPMF